MPSQPIQSLQHCGWLLSLADGVVSPWKQYAGNLAHRGNHNRKSNEETNLMIYGGKWQRIAFKNKLTFPEIPSFPLPAMMVAVKQNSACRNGVIPRKIWGIWPNQAPGWSWVMLRWGRSWPTWCCGGICRDRGDMVAVVEILMEKRNSSVAILFFCVL